jgi:poly(3-hydroxybutyrate) depolymerase
VALLSLLGVYITLSNTGIFSGSLQKLNVDQSKISVSGLSSGAFFAVQFHFAHSANIMGNAVFAGGPFYCAQGQLTTATLSCMQTMMQLNIDTLISKAQTLAGSGKIDPIEHISSSNVFIYSGSSDSVVNPNVVKASEQMYSKLGAKVLSKYDIASEHAMITTGFGNSCNYKGSPYINNCNYNGALSALNQIYGNLTQPTTANAQNLIEFDQSSYKKYGTSMHSKGYLYVPNNCKGGANSCRLHVVFHGCAQTLDDISTNYVEKTGYNEVAEANDIIILYPQASKSTFMPSNPQGCWDWWGYTDGMLPLGGDTYVTKDAAQIQAVWNMIKDISGLN